MTSRLTLKNMTKRSFISMHIFSNQFLPWWILGHIQWWQAFICVPPKNKESTMSAYVGSSKCLTKWMDNATLRFRKWRIWRSYLTLILLRQQYNLCINLISSRFNLKVNINYLHRILDGKLNEGIFWSSPWCIDASSCSIWPCGK